MTLLEIYRNKAFWLIDFLKGGKVAHYLNLLNSCENNRVSSDEICNFQKQELETLLDHAKKTVPYYHGLSTHDITEWPVMNKSIIRSNYESFCSNNFNSDELIHMSTSGSTGTPFESLQNIDKKKSINAETLFYNGKTGYKIGRRIIYLRSVVAETQKTKLQQFLQNIYLLDCTDLSDEGIKEKIEFIKKYSKKCGAMLMGYSSTLDAFRDYFERHGYDEAIGCNLYGIVGGSTMLYDETRAAMEKAFHCKCFSRYANEENGFLGQDEEENNVFLMNRANYFVEVLKFDSDEYAEKYEVGRIVVTDLRNMAMPMIRYDTGDVGAWVKYKGFDYRAIGNFGGRSIDMIYDSNGRLISPHSISTAMWYNAPRN